MQQAFHKQSKRGFGLIEVAIGAAIILVGIISLLASFNFYVQYALSNARVIQAAYLAEEGIEALKFMRDVSWENTIAPLSEGTTYYLVWESGMWLATTTPEVYIDGRFLREIAVTNVYRDSNSDIAASGTLDTNTKKVTATVSYSSGHATSSKAITTYITNLFGN